MTPSRALAEFAASLAFDDIPPGVVAHAKLCILDGLGCALFGSGLDVGRVTADYALGIEGRQEASLWGFAGRAPASLAALVNGTLVAHGEVVVVNEKFGIRLTDVISPADRVKKLK